MGGGSGGLAHALAHACLSRWHSRKQKVPSRISNAKPGQQLRMPDVCMRGRTHGTATEQRLAWVHVGGADFRAAQLRRNHLLQARVAGGVVVAVPWLKGLAPLLDLGVCCLCTLPHGPHHSRRRAAVVVAGPPLAAAAGQPAGAAAQAACQPVRDHGAQPRRWGARGHMHQALGGLQAARQRPHECKGS